MTRRLPRHIRGTNYFPSTMAGIDNALKMLPKDRSRLHLIPGTEGLFDRRHTRDELTEIAAAGFNNVRLWPSFFAWLIHPQEYVKTLGDIVTACRDLRLTMTYIVWNCAESIGPSIAPLVFAHLAEIPRADHEQSPRQHVVASPPSVGDSSRLRWSSSDPTGRAVACWHS